MKTLHLLCASMSLSLFAAACLAPTGTDPSAEEQKGAAAQPGETEQAVHPDDSGEIVIVTYYNDAGSTVGSCITNTCPNMVKGRECRGTQTTHHSTDIEPCF